MRKLTERQERKLNSALSLDDLLHRKFEYLNWQLDRRVQQFWNKPRNVVAVYGVAKNGARYALRIDRINPTADGTIIEVGLPFEGAKKAKKAGAK